MIPHNAHTAAGQIHRYKHFSSSLEARRKEFRWQHKEETGRHQITHHINADLHHLMISSKQSVQWLCKNNQKPAEQVPSCRIIPQTYPQYFSTFVLFSLRCNFVPTKVVIAIGKGIDPTIQTILHQSFQRFPRQLRNRFPACLSNTWITIFATTQYMAALSRLPESWIRSIDFGETP